MKAKLINNQLQYATNFEKIGDNWVSNPTAEMMASEGFKDAVYQEVDIITQPYSETDTEVIIYVQKPEIDKPEENESPIQ